MPSYQSILESPVEYLKGVGPAKAALLNTELAIFICRDLLHHYPFRYVDKTRFHKIRDLSSESDTVQLKGVVRRVDNKGEGRGKRLVARLRDDTAAIDLVWFRGISWMSKTLKVGEEYIVYGKINAYNDFLSIPHPEIELVSSMNVEEQSRLGPVYHSTEKLNNKGLEARGRRRIIKSLIDKLRPSDIPENLPGYLIADRKFISRYKAMRAIHLPKSEEELAAAIARYAERCHQRVYFREGWGSFSYFL